LPKEEMVNYVLKENGTRHVNYSDKKAYIENLRSSFDPIKF
jgi:hypothetical protein